MARKFGSKNPEPTSESTSESATEPIKSETENQESTTANEEGGTAPDYANLEAKCAQQEQTIADLATQLARLRADFDNYRRRTKGELEEMTSRAGEKLITNLLPVLDNLDRACDATVQAGNASNITAGVELVRRGLLDILAQEGLEEVPGVGAPFDPHIHEAVDRVGDETTHVVALYQKGYQLAGRVLRAAMVKVGSQSAADSNAQ